VIPAELAGAGSRGRSRPGCASAPIPGLDHAMLLSDSVAIILDAEAVLQSDSSTS
jgi:hypothetical protein